MRTMIIATVAALGFSAAPALPDNASGYVFPNFWGDTAQQQEAAIQAPAHSSSGTSIGAYVTQSGHGTWLFPPNPNGGANG